MRVHLGSDHAGLELKEHLLNWLADHGYEAVDHGPFVYDAQDDYPVFCLRAAEAVAADAGRRTAWAWSSAAPATARRSPPTRSRASAPRSPGARRPPTLAREHNDANVVSVGGRMHTLEDMTRFVEVFLDHAFTGEERHARRIAMLADYEKTGEPAAAAGVRAGPGPGQRRCLRATPSSGSPDARRALRRPGRSGLQPAGPVRRVRRAARRHRCSRAPSRTASTCSSSSRSDRLRARAPRALRQVRRARGRAGAAPVGQVRLRLVADDDARRRTPTCAAPPPAS